MRTLQERVESLYRHSIDDRRKKTDRVFAVLMPLQWLGGMLGAFYISPLAWSGVSSSVHPHVWAAAVLGGGLTALPVYLALTQPSTTTSRQIIAACQMLMSALLIHLTGGRIETHFHIFGSLAFLAFYLDWRALATASTLVALDHLLRGIYWPQSVYGILAPEPWRWLEHTAWVLFEDLFLIANIRHDLALRRELSLRQATLETTNAGIEQLVQQRTAELAQREESHRRLVESIPDGIFVEQQGRLVYANTALARILEVPESHRLVGTPTEDLAPKEERASFLGLLYGLAEGGRGARVELELQRLNGTTARVELSAIPFVHDGAAAIQAIARDVTERDKARERLERSENELRHMHKMDAVGRLAGGIAHDFNNLLTAITGYAHLLLPTFEATDRRRADLQEIASTAERAARLTRQLLAFGRKQVLEPRELDLNVVLVEMTSMLRRLIGENIELSIVSYPKPATVLVDRGQMEQVLVNLVVNARDAMPRGGRVVLETRKVFLDGSSPDLRPGMTRGAYVILTVSDTGDGIPPEALSQIFEPFFTTKPRGAGTGLGLSTVYGIVRQSEGFIDVSSEPGKGTRFRIFLAALPVPAAPEPTAVVETERLGGAETILLVEDEAGVRRLARRVLDRCGYRVLEAEGGQTAIELSRSHPGRIDLVLTDVVMPRVSGREVAETVVQDHPEAKVLYMSGYPAPILGRQGVLDSGVALLQKPFSPSVLSQRVREALDR